MAGQNILQAASSSPKLLASTQLADALEDTVYTVPASASTVLKQGTLCNISAAPVNVTVALMKSGQATGTTTHRVISAYSIAAGDTLGLADYIRDHCLGPGDFMTVQASVANAIDVVVSGIENT